GARARQLAGLVWLPGVRAGAVYADAESTKFWELDALCRWNCCRNCWGYIDVLAGYRYLQFGDRVRVIEQLTPLATPGSQINLVDEFSASNRFNGGVVGLAAGYTYGMWFVDRHTHFAVCPSARTVSISGGSRVVC